jgi:nicotinate-nucleotide adenylyltransferase
VTVGLLGGAFDPPHNGHLVLAQAALERFALERLLVVVTGEPPHKEVSTDPQTRYLLAEAAFRGRPRVELSRHELDTPGPSYTVETVRWAAGRYGDVIFLVGADEFASFLDWRDPQGVLRWARLGVATRPGYPRERLETVLARLERPDRVELFEIEAVPVSSTGVRDRVRRGEPIGGLVPDEVARLIAELGLYRSP